MVSFCCNVCNDVITKGKVINHSRSCGSHSFSCVDCMVVFDLDTIKPHVSCISEVAKYQGKYASTPNGNPIKRNRVPDSDDDEPPKQQVKPKRVVPTFSDSDDDDWVKSKKPTTPAAPKKRAASPKASPISSPAIAPTHSTPSIVISRVDKTSGETAHEDVRIESFVLGSADVIAEISRNILDESGQSSLSVKDISKKVVERFQARLAKQIKDAVEHSVATAGSRHGVRQIGSNIEKH
jgi:cell growth-regulating nucleolar protein